MLDIVIEQTAVLGVSGLVDVGITGDRIAAIAPNLPGGRRIAACGCMLTPGLVETHYHLDKACILDRCPAAEGTVLEAVRLTSAAKRHFTPDDVHARGSRVLERAITWGTTRMRTQVEVDPGIGMRGFDGVQQLVRDFAWAMDIEICVFPQEGLLNNPGTEALLIEGLKRGARVLGATPYTDTDPIGQIDRIFAIARDFDVDIDMHLDMGDTPNGMTVEHVCRRTEEYGWGGRVTVGHVTQLSLVAAPRFAAIAATLAGGEAAIADDDMRALAEMDEAFHVAVATASGNRTLAKMVVTLHHQTARYWLSTMTPPSRDESLAALHEHRALADAIAARDPARARAEMEKVLGEWPADADS